jgi:hypothetical protein
MRFKQSIERIAPKGTVQFHDLHDKELYSRFSILNYDDCIKTIHMLKSVDEVLVGDEVVKFLIGEFPQSAKFSWLIESKAGEKAVNLFYNAINKNRKSLGCKSCVS